MNSYFTLTHTQHFEMEIKRSRFITSIASVKDKKQAKAFIQSLRDKYPDANHHCWAMIAGRPDDIYQYDQSDDGEPKGTAGKPYLLIRFN